jgi:exosortase/archaeosortase family protein
MLMKLKIRKFTKEQKRLWNTLQFIIRFTLLSIPLYLILWLNLSMAPIQQTVAGHAAWAIRALGLTVTMNNLVLTVGPGEPFTFFIGPDCIGWKSVLAFIALVLATLGASMKKRILGIAIGVPLIYLGNLARIIIVVLVERSYGLEAARVFHDWLWQAGLIALVLLLWLAWLGWERLHPRAVSSLKRHKHIIKRK